MLANHPGSKLIVTLCSPPHCNQKTERPDAAHTRPTFRLEDGYDPSLGGVKFFALEPTARSPVAEARMVRLDARLAEATLAYPFLFDFEDTTVALVDHLSLDHQVVGVACQPTGQLQRDTIAEFDFTAIKISRTIQRDHNLIRCMLSEAAISTEATLTAEAALALNAALMASRSTAPVATVIATEVIDELRLNRQYQIERLSRQASTFNFHFVANVEKGLAAMTIYPRSNIEIDIEVSTATIEAMIRSGVSGRCRKGGSQRYREGQCVSFIHLQHRCTCLSVASVMPAACGG